MANSNNGGIYAPLKQIISDSESEDDSNKHEMHNHCRDRLSENCKNININNGLQSIKSNNFSMSDIDDQNTYLNTLETTMDNVSFLQIDDGNKMSFARKCLFIASILLCIFTVVFFLWVLPCSESGVCAANVWHDKTTSWEIPYDDIELKGPISVVDGAVSDGKNLIFLYRGNTMQSDKSRKDNNSNKNGILLIVGSSGKIGWFTRESRLPTDIDCKLLDVDNDGRYDCVVVGTEGMLATLNPISGTFYWYFHQHGGVNNIIGSVDFPLLLMDINSDGVNDLLTTCSISPSSYHNKLVIISGAKGSVIGKPLTMSNCTSIRKLAIDKTHMISFICKNVTTSSESLNVIAFSELYKKIMEKPLSITWKRWNPMKQHKSTIPKQTDMRKFYETEHGKLMIENRGACPDNCKINVQLLVQRNNTNSVSWEYTANHVYGMTPNTFSFANSIHGFVLKL